VSNHKAIRDMKKLKNYVCSEFFSGNVWVGYTSGPKYVPHASDSLLSAISQISLIEIFIDR